MTWLLDLETSINVAEQNVIYYAGPVVAKPTNSCLIKLPQFSYYTQALNILQVAFRATYGGYHAVTALQLQSQDVSDMFHRANRL